MKKINKLLLVISLFCYLIIPSNVLAATCSEYCSDVAPAVRLVKNVIVPLFQIVVPIILIVYGMIDFSKATVASKEEEMKKAQGMFIKRCIYGVGVFFVVTIVTIVMGLFSDTKSGIKGTEDWWSCYSNVEVCRDTSYGTTEKKYDDTLKRKERKAAKETNKKDQNSGGSGSGSSSSSKKYSSTVYVGDSRTVGMCGSVSTSSSENCDIAKVGMGYNWFESTAVPQIESKLKSNSKTNIVINMGTNDAGGDASRGNSSAKKYVEKFNSLASQYPDTNFIVISLTQVEDSKAASYKYNIRNSDIIAFNNYVKSNISSKIQYCDVYSKIDGKYSTTDGLHYDNNTYKIIYDAIQSCL